MPLLGKHRRDEENEDVFTLQPLRHEKRIRDGSEQDTNIFLDQRYSFPQRLPFHIQPPSPSSDPEDSDVTSPSSLMSPPDAEDVEMDDDVSEISPKSTSPTRSFPRPARLNPRSLHSHVTETGGRQPTPIKGAFQNDVPQHSPRPLGPGGMSDGPIKSRTVTNRLRNKDHFMPTPVTEAPMETPSILVSNTLSRLNVSGEENMDMDDNPMLPPAEMPRGRRRSGAITEKRRFAIGYREDCEKCRQRVPGHFSHFLPS